MALSFGFWHSMLNVFLWLITFVMSCHLEGTKKTTYYLQIIKYTIMDANWLLNCRVPRGYYFLGRTVWRAFYDAFSSPSLEDQTQETHTQNFIEIKFGLEPRTFGLMLVNSTEHQPLHHGSSSADRPSIL